MEKRKTPFPDAILSKKKDEVKEWTMTAPAKLCANENVTLRNAESAFPDLTAHRKPTVLTVSDGSV